MSDARALSLVLSRCVLLTPCDEEAEHLALCAAITPNFAQQVFKSIGPHHFVHPGHRKRYVFLRDSGLRKEMGNFGKLTSGLTCLPDSMSVTLVIDRLEASFRLRQAWKLARYILEGVVDDDENAISNAQNQLASEGRKWGEGISQNAPPALSGI